MRKCPYTPKQYRKYPDAIERIQLYLLTTFGKEAVWIFHHDCTVHLKMVRNCPECKKPYIKQYGRTAHLLTDGGLGEDAGCYITKWESAFKPKEAL